MVLLLAGQIAIAESIVDVVLCCWLHCCNCAPSIAYSLVCGGSFKSCAVQVQLINQTQTTYLRRNNSVQRTQEGFCNSKTYNLFSC